MGPRKKGFNVLRVQGVQGEDPLEHGDEQEKLNDDHSHS